MKVTFISDNGVQEVRTNVRKVEVVRGQTLIHHGRGTLHGRGTTYVPRGWRVVIR